MRQVKEEQIIIEWPGEKYKCVECNRIKERKTMFNFLFKYP